MGRIGRSFQLVGESYKTLMQDKELMILPLASGIVIAAIGVGVWFGFGLDPASVERHGPDVYVPLFLMYVATYTVGIFFQAAVVAGATERMRGGDPTVSSALAAAGRRIGAIVMWAVVAATVGTVVRMIHDRVGGVGKIVAGLIGVAWSLATFFIVPVLVLEDRPIGASFKRSVSVFKATWGETVVGGASLGLAALCGWLALAAVAGLLSQVAVPLALAVFGVGAACLTILFSALHGVYVASLYRYATEGQAASGFDRSLLEQAFVPKRR